MFAVHRGKPSRRKFQILISDRRSARMSGKFKAALCLFLHCHRTETDKSDFGLIFIDNLFNVLGFQVNRGTRTPVLTNMPK